MAWRMLVYTVDPDIRSRLHDIVATAASVTCMQPSQHPGCGACAAPEGGGGGHVAWFACAVRPAFLAGICLARSAAVTTVTFLGSRRPSKGYVDLAMARNISYLSLGAVCSTNEDKTGRRAGEDRGRTSCSVDGCRNHVEAARDLNGYERCGW